MKDLEERSQQENLAGTVKFHRILILVVTKQNYNEWPKKVGDIKQDEKPSNLLEEIKQSLSREKSNH